MPTDYTIRDAAFAVEATHFEFQCLWAENDRRKRVTWEHVSMGYMHQVGTCAGMPVTVSIMFAILDGVLVAFYDATSMVVDHSMVEAWLKEESVAFARGNKCDGVNFHNCIGALPGLAKIVQAGA